MLRFSCSCLAGGRWFCSPRVSSALGNAAAATHHTQPDSQTSKFQWPQDQPGDPNSCCKVGILQLGELLICKADLEIALCLGRGGTGRGAGQRALPQFHLTGSFGKNLLVIQRSLSVESQTRWGSVQEQLDSWIQSLSLTPPNHCSPRGTAVSPFQTGQFSHMSRVMEYPGLEKILRDHQLQLLAPHSSSNVIDLRYLSCLRSQNRLISLEFHFFLSPAHSSWDS